MATDVPLISSYKRGFVARRLFHTLTGVKLFPGTTPVYSWLLRLGLWITPGSLSLAASMASMAIPLYPLWASAAVLVAVFHVSVHLLSLWRQSKVGRRESQLMVDEEASLDWDGVLGPVTWSLLIPSRTFRINILLFSVIAAAISFLSSMILRYQVIDNFFPGKGVTVTVFVLSWMTVFISLQSLLVHPPPETATWRHVDNPELQAVVRPIILIMCQLATCVGVYFWNIFYIANIFYVVQALLPLGWLLGVLPPPDTFFIWIGEQIMIVCFGGSPTSSTSKLVAQLSAAVAQFAVMISSGMSQSQVLTVSSCSGYVLSTNWTALLGIIRYLKQKKQKITTDNNQSENNNYLRKLEKSKSMKSVTRAAIISQEIVTHLFLFIICITLSISLSDSREFSLASSEYKNPHPRLWIEDVLGIIIMTMATVIKLFREVNKIYALFGIVRSPFHVSHKPGNRSSLAFSIVKFLIRFVHPICSGLVILTYLIQITLQSNANPLIHGSFLHLFHILSIQRTFRWVWQNTDQALVETAIYHIVTWFLDDDFIKNLTNLEMTEPMKLVIISFLWSRFEESMEKLYLFLSLTATSIEDRAARRSYAFLLFQLNIFLFPVIFFIILLTSILSSPMLSIFTLPIFFMTYPRPARFWPGNVGDNATASPDSIYYQQSVKNVLSSFNEAARMMKLGDLQPESMFLLRFEDKIFWIHVLEKGNSYYTYSLKGMELQETSCHSLEATRIDDIFDSAFVKQTKVNHFLFHTLTPLTSISVKMYSETRNSLTEVITDQNTLKHIAESFIEIMLWILIKCPKDFVKDPTVTSEASVVNVDEVIELKPEDVGKDDSWPSSATSSVDKDLAWAARSQMNPIWTPEVKHKPKLGSINYDGSNFSLDDIADLNDDLNSFEKYLEPLSTKKDGAKNNAKYVSPSNDLMDNLLPGGINKTPQVNRKNLVSKSVLLTPSKTPAEKQFNSWIHDRYKIADHWLIVCEKNNFDVKNSNQWFPKSFYGKILNNFEAFKDTLLLNAFTRFVAFIFETIYGRGSTPADAKLSGAKIVSRNFDTLNVDKTSWPRDMYDFVQQAYRYSVKIAIDKSIFGDLNDDELGSAIEDVHRNWFIGPETTYSWEESVKKEFPNLFSLSSSQSSESGQMIFKSKILTLTDCNVNVGRLNKEVVKSLWASLSLGKSF